MPNLPNFVDPERARRLVRTQPVVFAEIMGEASGTQTLEVHVMRPAAGGIHEVERDDTGPVTGEKAQIIVAQIAAAHNCRYATIYPAETRWPPSWR